MAEISYSLVAVTDIPQPGETLLGKYRVDRVLGASMGIVLAVTHIDLMQPFVIKLLRDTRADEDSKARFMREARVAARFTNEHAVKVHDFGLLNDGTPYMVMEHLEGSDLRALLKQRGALPLDEVVTLVYHACEALAEAHALGIVHRDIKPANLFLTHRHSGAPCLKVLDFGISKEINVTEHLTRSGIGMGTPPYMSPEQIYDAKSVDARCDIWAMGVVMYELITGKSPFMDERMDRIIMNVLLSVPEPPSRLRPELPIMFDEMVARCLSKGREERYATIGELAAAVWSLDSSCGARPQSTALQRPMTAEIEPTVQVARETGHSTMQTVRNPGGTVPQTASRQKASPASDLSQNSGNAGDLSDSQWGIDFNAVIRLPTHDPWRWTVVLSRDEASRHGDLMISLKRKASQERPRYIDSGFAYWGIGPTIQWRRVCQDSFYKVMRKGIDTFQNRWTELVRNARRDLPRIYVSYGVGTGEKDRAILTTMNAVRGAPVYVPTDMSLDMLVNGAKAASTDVVESSRIIPLQIDFSSASELLTISEIRKNVFGERPVLFSLLGNTLANFENDVATLKTLAELMKDGDLMLIELAATKIVNKDSVALASVEYSSIPSFESFVLSALTQHTDLPMNELEYHCEECHDGGALQIDMNYVSAARCRGRLIDGSVVELKPKEKIRLYRSRKYMQATITRMLGQAGLKEITSDIQWNDRSSPFGLYLGFCSK